MDQNKYEEKKKDEILQKLLESLDGEDWGGCMDSLVLEVIFRNKFECDVMVRYKNKKFFQR